MNIINVILNHQKVWKGEVSSRGATPKACQTHSWASGTHLWLLRIWRTHLSGRPWKVMQLLRHQFLNVDECGRIWLWMVMSLHRLQARDSATSSGRVPTKICSGELSELRSTGVPTVITNRPYMLRLDCGCFALAASFRCLHDHVTCQSLCVSLPHLIISTISVWPECDHLCGSYIPDFRLRWY